MERTCSVCEDPLPLGSSHQRLYCGQPCKEKARWAQVKADPVRQAYARTKNRRAVDAYQAKHPRPVRWLAAQRKLAKAAQGKPTTGRWYMGWCVECGLAFVGNQPSQVVCSRRCGIKRSNDRHDLRKRTQRVEDVWRNRVFERDNWYCQLCHKPVRRDKSVPHRLAPTLDHIVPLARGGEHSYANVQLAHFLCNALKSDGPSQLRLCA